MYTQRFVSGFFTTLGAITAVSLVFPFLSFNIDCSVLRDNRKKCSYRQDFNYDYENVVSPSEN